MAVTHVDDKFKSSDGRRFRRRSDAATHEHLVISSRNYEKARQALATALATSCKTEDGQLFDPGISRRYFYIRRSAYGLPIMTEVPFVGWNFYVETTTNPDDVVIIIHSQTRPLRYRISEMYADPIKAEIALLSMQKAVLREWEEEVRKLEDRLLKSGHIEGETHAQP